MKTKTKSFDAVAESRKWRIETGRKLGAMSRAERFAYLAQVRERYLKERQGLAASFAKAAEQEKPAAPKPAKAFDAVAESRKWKEAVERETAGMSTAERMAYFRRHSSVPEIAARARVSQEETCVVREEPPKP